MMRVPNHVLAHLASRRLVYVCYAIYRYILTTTLNTHILLVRRLIRPSQVAIIGRRLAIFDEFLRVIEDPLILFITVVFEGDLVFVLFLGCVMNRFAQSSITG